MVNNNSLKREVHVYHAGGKVRISTPYNSDFVKELKERLTSRRWDPKQKQWIVNIEEYDQALEIVDLPPKVVPATELELPVF